VNTPGLRSSAWLVRITRCNQRDLGFLADAMALHHGISPHRCTHLSATIQMLRNWTGSP
jgi:hypothetical protein